MNDAKTELDRILGDARNREDMIEVLTDMLPKMVDVYGKKAVKFKPNDSRRHCDLAMSASVSMAATLFIHAIESLETDEPDQIKALMDYWLGATEQAIVAALKEYGDEQSNKPGGYH